MIQPVPLWLDAGTEDCGDFEYCQTCWGFQIAQIENRENKKVTK